MPTTRTVTFVRRATRRMVTRRAAPRPEGEPAAVAQIAEHVALGRAGRRHLIVSTPR